MKKRKAELDFNPPLPEMKCFVKTLFKTIKNVSHRDFNFGGHGTGPLLLLMFNESLSEGSEHRD